MKQAVAGFQFAEDDMYIGINATGLSEDLPVEIWMFHEHAARSKTQLVRMLVALEDMG